MSIFNDIINDEKGKIIISIIWGLGLATLFRRACKGRNCIIIKGPKPSELEKKIFNFNGQCYNYKAETTSCKKENK